MSRPTLVACAVVALVCGFAPATATATAPATAATAAPAPPLCAFGSEPYANGQDLDHDANHERDVVVGVPRAGAGAVDIAFDLLHHGQRLRVDQSYFDNVPAAGPHDQFGAAVSYADFPEQADGSTDACVDLAIGAPGSDSATGSVLLVHGAGTGVRRADAIRLVGATPGERFGAAVVAQNADIFVAAPDRAVAGHLHAGAVDHYVVQADGTARRVGVITQAAAGVPGVAETGDRFGSRLAVSGDVVLIGDPDEANGAAKQAGTVTALRYDSHMQTLVAAKLLSKSSALGGFQSGDRFGAGLAVPDNGSLRVVVGIPGQRVGGHAGAGAVQLFQSDTGGANFLAHLVVTRSVSQDSPGVPGSSETGDGFGASVATTSLQQCHSSDTSPFAVGSPGEDVATIHDAGSVTIVAATPPGTRKQAPACLHAWYLGFKGAGGLGGVARADDALGATVGDAQPWVYGDFDVENHSAPGFVLGVPGADTAQARDAGAVIVLQPWEPATHATVNDSAGARAGERYGEVRAAN